MCRLPPHFSVLALTMLNYRMSSNRTVCTFTAAVFLFSRRLPATPKLV